jgi:hypothetical protein
MIRGAAPCAVGLLAALNGCGAVAPLPAPPAAQTRADLVGALCTGGQCRCRERELVGTPPAGKKRYHVKLGPAAQPLWLSVDDIVLYKDQQRGEACFVIDLEPGSHAVRLRAQGTNGVAAAVSLEELGISPESGEEWWYDSFRFHCGAPDLCDRGLLSQEEDRLKRLGDKHDRCGATKVHGVAWRTGTASDGAHPDDLEVELKLEVYKFEPTKAPCPGRPAG